MRKYDTTFIIDGSLGVNEREALIEKFSNLLTKLSGKIDRTVRWGQRNLAYQINKRAQGYYVIFYHTSEPSIIKPFERELSINESILRFMTLVFDGNHPSYIPDESFKGAVASHVDLPVELPEVPEDFDEILEETDTLEDEVFEEEEKEIDLAKDYSENDDTSSDQESNEDNTTENTGDTNKEDGKE
jgi:small subunit ribosomal protein S6